MDESAWAFNLATQIVERPFDTDGRIILEDGPFSGFIERNIVRPGIALYRAEGHSSHGWSLSAMGNSPPGHLVLGCMLSGAGGIVANGNDDQVWRDQRQLFALSLAERDIVYRLEARKHWQVITLLVEPQALEALAQSEGLPPLARAILDDGHLPISQMQPLSAEAQRAASELMQPVYAGAMRTLYREAKALELLAHQLDSLIDQPLAPKQLSNRELARVREARERLMADLRAPPSLDALASSVGLSTRRLNAGFRQLFGMTVFGYLLETRLQSARRMIEEGSDIPLKHIAWMVGYGQVTNFINAYRRRFGVSPGRHRKMRSTDD